MPRPKKPKQEFEEPTAFAKPGEEPVKFETKADVMPAMKVEQKPWTPSPDMGAIKPPTPAEKKCACLHLGEKHYGGPKGWCNVGGCDCQEFKS